MISRGSRLPYDEFRARGYRQITTLHFLVKAKRNLLKKNRFGFVASAASIKKATQRNFWRRQAKTAFLKIPPKGLDLLMILRRSAPLSDKSVIHMELNKTISTLISDL